MNHEIVNHDTMSHKTATRALITMTTAIFACVVLVMVFGVGKLTETLDPLVARRGVGVTIGLILMVTGNFVPKLRLFQPATGAAQGDAIDRFAGWIFVVCGLAFAAVFLSAPADKVFIVPPFIVLAGFLAVLARWLMSKGKQPSRLSLHWTPGRLALATMLATVLWTCAIFYADTVWGDNVSRWMAILFPFILICFSAFRARRSAEEETNRPGEKS
jgi:hypothetical protein